MSDNTTRLASAYSQTPKNELELNLEAQKQPGYVPDGGMGAWALAASLRALAITNPERYQRVKAAQVNGASEAVIRSILRGEQ